MLIEYVQKNFGAKALDVIQKANAIIKEYQAQGFDLTLRQLYYQFVARALIPNRMSEYKNLGSIINDARLAGLISWEAIVDRTRNLQKNSHWENPHSIVDACAAQYQIDKWAKQPNHVEVWIEKDALIGVIEKACNALDVPYFSCRGYTSQSEMWAAGRRLQEYAQDGQEPVVIHLGDHDPSGIDMSRDIEDRLVMFSEGTVEVNRIALNMNQVETYNPPPNPAKITDTRAKAYIRQYGSESWELDALDPRLLEKLITKTVLKYRDEDIWEKSLREENGHKKTLLTAAKEMRTKYEGKRK